MFPPAVCVTSGDRVCEGSQSSGLISSELGMHWYQYRPRYRAQDKYLYLYSQNYTDTTKCACGIVYSD